MGGTAASDPRIGTELAGYRIEAVLGRGGMSVVYLAEDPALGRKVALKLLSRELAGDQRFHERFRLESRLAASIDHPHVIPIYEAGEAMGQLFIAMRYVEGTDLRLTLAREGTLAAERTVNLLEQIAEGLDAAHTRGLIHRDVKPSNILIAGSGAQEHVYLADFGLTRTVAEMADPDLTTRLSGTTDYVAPEQISEGRAEASADIYSLGCLLYECLTGRVPYERVSEFETLWAHLDDPPPRPTDARPELPGALDDVVAKAMAKDPAQRYAGAAELATAARDALPAPRRVGRTWVGVAAAAAAIGAAVVAIALSGGDESAPSPTAPTLNLSGGAVQRVETEDMRLDATIAVSGEPIDVAAGPAGIWLVGGAGPSFERIDPATNETTRGPALPGIEAGITARPESPWIASHGESGEGLVIELGLENRSVREVALRDLDVGPKAAATPAVNALSVLVADPRATASGFAGWVVDAADGSLLELEVDERGDGRLDEIETGGNPLDLAVSDGRLWVAQKGEVIEVTFGRAPFDSRVVSRTSVPGTPITVAADEEGAWIATREGVLYRIARDGHLARRVRTNEGLPDWLAQGRPVDLALGEGSLWLLLSDGTLEPLDPQSGESRGTVEIGSNPVGLAVADGTAWVAVRGGEELGRLPHRFTASARTYLLGDPCPPGRVACAIAFGGELEAADGTEALFEGALRERRVPGGSIRCDGERYDGAAIANVADPGAGRVRIARWGTVALQAHRLVAAAEEAEIAAGPPLCRVVSGRWIGTSAAVKGMSGPFTLSGLRLRDLELILR